MSAQTAPPKRKRKAPPDGYVCKLCATPGHWVHECSKCERRPKKPKAPAAAAPVAKPNPCVSTEEARVKCHCGLRATKRRFWAADSPAPEQRWICGKLKKHKIKRGDSNLKPCKFSRPVGAGDDAPADAPPAKKRVNTRYLQRDRRRKLKCKLFVSGLPFSASPAEALAAFCAEHGAEAPARVATLKKGGRKTGQAYATFASAEAAEACLALSGSKLAGGRWLEFRRVEEKKKEKKGDDGESGGESSSESEDEEE